MGMQIFWELKNKEIKHAIKDNSECG